MGETAREVLEELERRGVPHLYGEQRFGVRGEGPALGRALLRNDPETFLAVLLGRPSDRERDPRVRQARDLYDRGDREGASRAFPPHRRLERRALEGLQRGLSPAEVLYTLPASDKRFFLTSYQSMLFNRCLLRRFPEVDSVWEGDLVREEPTEHIRLAADLDADRAAAREFRLSPTGFLPGHAVTLALGRQGILEREILEEEVMRPADFLRPAGLPCRGERRPLRVRISEVSVGEEDGALALRFFLPRGAFATSVLREVLKPADEPEAVLGAMPRLFR
jgi:tRNA pseudouridine13 synthase